MNRLFKLLLSFTLLCGVLPGQAQQTKTTKNKTQTKKEVTAKDDLPPEIERFEDVKIDPVPVLPFIDTTAAPNDALTAAIREMLEVSNAVNMGLSVAEKLIIEQKEVDSNEKMNQFYDRFLTEIKSERTKRLFENIFIKIYRKHYSLEETKQLTEFYKTPLGRKTLEVTPATLQESQSEGGKLGAFLAREIIQNLEKE